MKRLGLSSAIERAASGVQQAALGKRYIATVQSVTDRETTGWVICDVFFRDPAAEGRQTVRVNASVDLAADDLIYIKPDPAGQRTFIFDGFVKGGGTGNNDAGAFVPWTQAPGATSPVGMDYNITPAAGQDVIVDGVNWSTFAALEFVLMSADAAVANERVLTGGDGISLADGGAGAAATLAVDLPTGADWGGLEFDKGELRVDLDAVFDFASDVSVGGDLSVGTTAPNYNFEVHVASGYADIALSSDAVTQPATDIAAADVAARIGILSSTKGGLYVRALSDTDDTAMILAGIMGTANPTDATPAIILRSHKSDGGTAVAALAAAETVLQVQNQLTALMTILGDGKVGIGTVTPVVNLDVRGAGANAVMRVGYNSTNSVRGDLIAFAASVRFNAYDDNAADYVLLDFRGKPVTFSIGTTEGMRVHTDGRVGLRIAAPLGQLHVNQLGPGSAIPPLYLTQADVDQDMIEFACTIGVGNAIEAVGGKTLTTTHFIKCTLPGGLTRYFPVGTIA